EAGPSQGPSASGTLGVAQRPHLVVVAQHPLVLALHQGTDLCRQVLLQGALIAAFGHILATLAFAEDRLIVLAGDQRLEIHPAAVQVSGNTGVGFRLATQAANLLLQLDGGIRALPGALLEQGLQLGAADVLGANAKALLTIPAGFDQLRSEEHTSELQSRE